MHECQNFIAGEYRASGNGGSTEIYSPVTNQPYARAPESGWCDVDDAMQAAATAFRSWSQTTPADRQEVLLRVAASIAEHGEELLTAECGNTGKPKALTREAELDEIVNQVRFIAGATRCLEGRSAGEYLKGHTSYVRREPIGVCAQIVPWNYPLMMAVWKCVPAIATGNTVVLKPSELTPISTLLLAGLVSDIVPPGVFNVVCGNGDTGRAMAAHDVPSMVSLTGSVRAGSDVAAVAASGVKRTHLELGGKAPVVVFEDADVPSAAAGIAEAAYYNAGQDCAAATRILVAEQVHDELVDALVDQAAGVRVGPPDDPDATCGPLISDRQVVRVTGFLNRLPAHATVRAGGERIGTTGNFLSPAVVTGVRHDDEIAQAEVFGPVLTVERVKNEDDALAAANSVDYGLTSSIWTRDHGRIMRMTRGLDFGCVWVNTHLPLPAEMPHGGFNHSGYGKDMSIYGLEDYTRIKHVMSNNHI